MKKWLKEFKEFAVNPSLITVAVGLVMALALAALVTALVENVIMPIVGIIFGEPTFDSLTLTINDSVISYGTFITALVAFLAIAAAVFFFIVKPYNSYKKRQETGEEPPEEPSEEILLLRAIRDGLRR